MSLSLSSSYTSPPLWTPANINTALWLDAADASTITTVSGAVSQWNDKSGNNRNATQGTAASRPAYTTAGLNGLATVTPDGSNDWMTCSPVFSGTTPDNYFVIAALRMLSIINSGLNTDNGLFYQTGSTVLNSNIYFHLAVSGSSNKPLTDLFPPSGGSLLGATATTANTSYLFATSRTSGTRAIWINGAIDASQTGAETYTGETTVATDLFMLRGSNNALNAHVGEIIALAYPSQANRERIEGYLAHKWGLTGNLPAGHPYKLLPPYASTLGGDPYWDKVSLLLPGTGANNSSVFTDRSPSPKTFTTFGDAKITTTVADPFGNSNGVITLDGTGDYATTPTDTALALSGVFTVELFYRISAVPGSYYMLLADEGTGSEYIAIKGNGYEIQFGATAGTICNGSVTIATNAWNYLAITRNASNVVALRHNTTTVTLSNTTQSSQLFGNGTAFHVGAWNPSGTPGLFFSGQLSNIRITKGIVRDVSTVPTLPFPVY